MFQKIIFVGNLGHDPELRYTPGGDPVCVLAIASHRFFTDREGQARNETTWWSTEVWGKRAQDCVQDLQKGSLVLVEGRMKPDPETGRPRIHARGGAEYDVVADLIRFLSPRPATQDAREDPAAIAEPALTQPELPLEGGK